MTVCEEYIDLVPVALISADTIFACIKDVLLHMNIIIHDAHGQCYNAGAGTPLSKRGADIF